MAVRMVSAMGRLFILLLLCAFIGLAGWSANAEILKPADSSELQLLIDQAQREGAHVVVIEAPVPVGNAEGAVARQGIPSLVTERALAARERLGEVLANAGVFFARAGQAIRQHHPEGSAAWPVKVVALVVLFLLLGYGAERLFHRWARPHFLYLFNATPQSAAEKIAYLLLRGFFQFIGLFIQLLVALLIALALDEGRDFIRNTHLVVIGTVGIVRGLAIFFHNLLAYDLPNHRMLNLSDDDAHGLHRGLMIILSIAALTTGLCIWMEELDLDRNAHLLSLLAATFVSMLLLSSFVIFKRRIVAGMILGAGEPSQKPAALRYFARTWHIPAVLYLLVAWCVTAGRLLLELPDALGLVLGPILIFFLAIAIYGVAALIIEWAFARGDHSGETGEAPVSPPAENNLQEGVIRFLTFKGLAQRAAKLIIAAVVFWWVLNLWGFDLADSGGAFAAFWEVILTLFLAYLAFQSVKIAVDRKIMEEGGFDEPEPGEEGGTKGSSRLATLLPLFRNFLLIVIVVIAAMIVLSELGLDIAPLFAGAGVVGLAVGFGAQALVRDIFSGAFFLMDDAFRKGEYIDIGSVKGTVEKISIRSMQLRHHMGPLHTIPFGEIQHLTNYSRDWVMMKLPLRVTYDTDVEKVRKMIKKLGQELLEHPEVGDKFLQPLKSQGVYQMEDSAMIVRVKFMTKPGDQFPVRKLVYAKIRELFEREGIKFAHREVTVRVADNPDSRTLTEEEKRAVAGAVQPLIEDEAVKTSSKDQR